MVSVEFSESISETLDILNHMDNIYISKLPKGFMNFLDNNKSSNYVSKLDHSKKLNEMNLKEKTKDILAVIYMNYWCDSKQKKDYTNLLKENEAKYQEELREKYNPDDIFKNRNRVIPQVEQPSEETRMTIVKEEKWYQKIFNLIKNFFHRN